MSVGGKQEKADALRSEADMSPIAAEENVMGITHAEIGFHLGEHWLLPPALTNAIRYHHSPELEPAPQDTSGIVFLANAFCKAAADGVANPDAFDERTLQVLENLGMSEVMFRKALDSYSVMERSADVEIF
jgi:HD-like signal output (HDOD) protein